MMFCIHSITTPSISIGCSCISSNRPSKCVDSDEKNNPCWHQVFVTWFVTFLYIGMRSFELPSISFVSKASDFQTLHYNGEFHSISSMETRLLWQALDNTWFNAQYLSFSNSLQTFSEWQQLSGSIERIRSVIHYSASSGCLQTPFVNVHIMYMHWKIYFLAITTLTYQYLTNVIL